MLIFFEQFLQTPLRNKNEIIGILSYHLIKLLQLGQQDRLVATFLFAGNRYIQTLAKLPHILPKTNAII